MELNEQILKCLKQALEDEKIAVETYKRFSKECKGEPHIEEMFLQFSKNERWHVLAIEEKINWFSSNDKKTVEE